MKKQKEKIKARLENWSHYVFYTLQGNVYGHPNFQDGQEVVTSAIKVANFPSSVETFNTVYQLGNKKKENQ